MLVGLFGVLPMVVQLTIFWQKSFGPHINNNYRRDNFPLGRLM